jgi:hypothetical protein
MADYYPLVARAVAGLEKNTGEARRALYERARTALVAQLRGTSPPLDEAEITRERLSLEEAIRKVETEAARRARQETGMAPGASQPLAPQPPAPQPVPPQPEPRPEPPRAEIPRMPAPSAPPPPAAKPPAAPRPAAPSRTTLTDEAMRGFRERAGTPEPSAPPPAPKKPARDPFAEVSAAHDFDQLESSVRPRLDNGAPQGLDAAEELPPVTRRRPPLGRDYDPEAGSPAGYDTGQEPGYESGHAGEDDAVPLRRAPRNLGGLVKIAAILLVAAGLIGILYWQRGAIGNMFQAMRGSQTQQTQSDAPAQPQGRPKISDRIGPGGGTQSEQVPAVAQRVVLYEEEPADPQGKRFIGSAIWRTETVSPGPGQPPELAIRADVEIPERRMNMTLSIRRNTDQTLPASHTVEIMFNLPADFPGGGIANVPGILMKQAEQTRGTPLAGLAVKVTNGFFLIGLSAVESDVQRNIALLKERAWFDIPIVYSNNRRAILAIEKGTPGERAFAEAFAAWKQ